MKIKLTFSYYTGCKATDFTQGNKLIKTN